MDPIRFAPVDDAALPALERYLAARADTAMFLRSNIRAAGLRWDGAPRQGQYLAAWDGDAVVGVVGHAWNGMLLVQCDPPVDELARAAVEHSGRAVAGLSGPLEQVVAARAALGLADTRATLDSAETLMALDLDALVVPRGATGVRRARAADRDTIVPWQAAYRVEATGEPDGPATVEAAATGFEHAIARGTLWLCEGPGGEPLAIAGFNATLPDRVQVGGVYTPPALRGRGHARAVVAGALLDARTTGVTRAILFTERADAAAAYRAIGFAAIGQYGLVMF